MRLSSRHGRSATLVVTVCLGVALSVLVESSADAQTTASRGSAMEAEQRRREAVRDSLRIEIQRYAEIIDALKDSVSEIDSEVDTEAVAREQRVARTAELVATLSEAVGGLAEELSELEVEFEDGRVSLTDGRGGRISVTIPENLSQHLSEGLGAITEAILEEIPDSLYIGSHETGITFGGFGRSVNVTPAAPLPPRKVIQGGVVKFKDDLEIAANEVVPGDAIVVMGDVLIDGRIEGDLVVVLGDLSLGETAEVDGQIITVLGRLDRAAGAKVGALTVVNANEALLPSVFSGETGDWIGFWGWQALFVLLVFLVLLMVALASRDRLDRLFTTLTDRPAECLGVGLLMALVGHLVLLGLGAILVLTVIGIPVAILVFLAVALLDLAAVGVASVVVGRHICSRGGRECTNLWREVLIGMVVLHVPAVVAALLGVAGIPFMIVLMISWLSRAVKFLAFCFGLGALVLGRFGTRVRSNPPMSAMGPASGSPVA